MSAKHFLSDPVHAVVTALKSLTLTNPSLAFDEPNKIVYRHPASIKNSGSKISLICGGGSGHEPAWVGYVGAGLLTACVAGTIFASPGAEQVRACVSHRLPKDSQGLLVIVMNYTGDVLNFGMGAEKARAMGMDVEMIVIGDDVGVGREKSGKVGRRGIAGGGLVVKVCGALAEMGGTLKEVANVGRLVGNNLVSVASSLSRVHVIGQDIKEADEELKRMPHGTIELGMGIHNEPGCEQFQTDLPGIVKTMLQQLLDQSDEDRAYVHIEKTDKTVMLINNFGGLSNLELGAITNEVWEQLTKNYSIRPVRLFQGVYNGSLNGLGFGVTLLKLVDTGLGSGKSLLELIDAPAEGIGWPQAIKIGTWDQEFPTIEETKVDENLVKSSSITIDPELFTAALKTGLEKVIAAEPLVTKYDSIVGDGDCGAGLKRGAEAVLASLTSQPPTKDLLTSFAPLVRAAETNMDGTSGAIYAIFLNSLAHDLRAQDTGKSVHADAALWATALQKSLHSLETYTPAKPGDRTLIDALDPFVQTLASTKSIKEAAAAASKGTESTKGMKPGLGRSVYVGGSGWQEVPDPGAYGLAQFLEGIASAL